MNCVALNFKIYYRLYDSHLQASLNYVEFVNSSFQVNFFAFIPFSLQFIVPAYEKSLYSYVITLYLKILFSTKDFFHVSFSLLLLFVELIKILYQTTWSNDLAFNQEICKLDFAPEPDLMAIASYTPFLFSTPLENRFST